MLDLLDRKSLFKSIPHGGIAAEIGVRTGALSETILSANQPRELWLVDIWKHQSVEVYGKDTSNAGDDKQERRFQAVTARFADRPQVKILREWSDVAATTFPDEYFDWWFLDANHMRVDTDIAAWWPKLKRGGWATGHDFCEPDVADYIKTKPQVEAFAAEHGFEIHVIGLKSDNAMERRYPSWAIMKP